MAVLKCKMCGGDIVVNEEKTYGMCDYCGSTMTLPKVSDDQRAARFNRGNHFRRQGEFDKALAVYETIVNEDETDAEAHWCCALCRFGIEYVEDPNTYEYLPTCHRASFDSFLEDADYLAALEYSDGITKRQYQKDAAKIAEVQKGILSTSQNEEPYDVFICYKETNDNTNERTRDSIDAQEIYYQLTQAGYRVFFSRITLEDKAGAEYEPYIFAALNSAKVMIAIGSKPEYFNAVWVKNEWSRFLSMMRKDRSKLLLPCYKDMDPYDMPEQLGVLQSYDMAKIGFIQDLIRGIKKILKKDEPKQAAKEKVVVQQSGNANVAPLLKRGILALEDGEWDKANEYFDQALNSDAECADAYVGMLMAELFVHRREDLANQEEPFNEYKNFKKAIRFGDDKLKDELNGYITCIIERNKDKAYSCAVEAMNAADSEYLYKEASELFKSLSGWRDADKLAEECLDKADIALKDAIYDSAKSQMTGTTVDGYESAIKIFSEISGWKDADEQIEACRKKIEEIKSKEEADRIEAEKKAEEERIAAEKRKKKRKKKIKKIAAIVTPIVVACIAFVIVLTTIIIPNGKYNSAVELYNEGKYDGAITAFKELNGYKDSEAQITKCKKCKYNAAVALIEKGDIINAYESLIALNGYKDSTQKAKEIYVQYTVEKLKLAKVGDYVVFGSYEQDDNTSNGKEDIEWLVLAKEGDKALVISKYALDCQLYDTSSDDVTWETCSLRKWLNGTFLNVAFSPEEQNSIVSSTVTADKNPSYSTSPGKNTTDKVFLLSITEVNKYFSTDSARVCQGTAYCFVQGAYEFDDGNCEWWLRSPGYNSDDAAEVLSDGSVSDIGRFVDRGGTAVRPAIWIGLG